MDKFKDFLHNCIDEIKGVTLMLSLMAVLTFVGAFSVFILHISITSDHPTLEELTKSLIPKLFLILIIWLLYNIFFNSNKEGRYWLLLKLYTDFKEMWRFMECDDKRNQT